MGSRNGHGGWQTRVDFDNGNYVLSESDAGMRNRITLVAPSAEMIEETQTSKLAEFRAQESDASSCEAALQSDAPDSSPEL